MSRRWRWDLARAWRRVGRTPQISPVVFRWRRSAETPRVHLGSTPVAPTSKSAVSRISQSAVVAMAWPRGFSDGPPIWKSATQRVWKPALRCAFGVRTTTLRGKVGRAVRCPPGLADGYWNNAGDSSTRFDAAAARAFLFSVPYISVSIRRHGSLVPRCASLLRSVRLAH